MKSKRTPAVVIVVVSLAVSVLAVLGGGVISAQDTSQAKYAVRECRMGSHSLNSEDTKAGRLSPSATTKS